MEIRGAVLPAAMLIVLAGTAVAVAAQDEVPASAYDRAAKMLDVASLIFHETVMPHWIGDGEAFWYRSDDRDGHRFWRVDPLASDERRRPAFDHARLAASLSALRDEPADPLALPFESIDLSSDGEVSFPDPGRERARVVPLHRRRSRVLVRRSAGRPGRREEREAGNAAPAVSRRGLQPRRAGSRPLPRHHRERRGGAA